MGELEVGVEFAQPQTDDTTAAVTVSSFHVDPVVDQNTVAVPGCAVRTGRGRGGGFDSRHDEPLNSRTSSLRTAAMQSGRFLYGECISDVLSFTHGKDGSLY